MSEALSFFFPSMMLFWTFFLAQNMMSDIHVEYERRTLRRMLSTTATVNQVLCAKIIRCMVMCLIAETLMMTVTRLVFGVKWGNPVYLLGILTLCNLTFTGLMTLVYSITKTKQAADSINVVIILLLGLLGGGMMPYEAMPEFMKSVAEVSAIRWGTVGLKSIMAGEGVSPLVMPSINFLIAGGITTALGCLFYKRRLEAGDL